jgi:hypothetical protein
MAAGEERRQTKNTCYEREVREWLKAESCEHAAGGSSHEAARAEKRVEG